MLWTSLAITLQGPVLAHGAHVHGKGELELSVSDGRLQGRFTTPMDSLLGFEYAPKTDQQKKQVNTLQKQLLDPSVLIALDPKAECKPVSAIAQSSMFTGAVEGDHSDLIYEFAFECANPSQLSSAEFVAFGRFRRLSSVSVELVLTSGQRAVTLTRRSPRLSF